MSFVSQWQHDNSDKCVWLINASRNQTSLLHDFNQFLKSSPPFSCLLIASDMDLVHNLLTQLESSFGFYLSSLGSDHVYKAFTFPKESRIVKMALNGSIDFQGVRIKAIAVNFDPIFKFEDGVTEINETYNYNGAHGVTFDVMRGLAKTLNFSLTLTKEPNNKWGTVPTHGSLGQPGAIFGPGMFKQVIDQEVDIAPMDFLTTKPRAFHIDFTMSFYTARGRCFISLKDVGVDSMLYFRPLTVISLQWTLCVTTVLVLILTPTYFNDHHILSNADGIRTFLYILGVFHVLIMGYYEGALTMFLASNPTLPFHSVEEGLRYHYPGWTPVVKSSVMKAQIEHQAEAQGLDISAKVVKGTHEAIRTIESGKYFLV